MEGLGLSGILANLQNLGYDPNSGTFGSTGNSGTALRDKATGTTSLPTPAKVPTVATDPGPTATSNPTPSPSIAPTPSPTTPAPNPTTSSFGSSSPSNPGFTVGENTTTHPVDNTNSWGTFSSNPTYNDYVKNVEGGTPGGAQLSGGVTAGQILQNRPDVYNQFFKSYNDRSLNDPNSTAWMDRVGGYKPEDYASMWWNNLASGADKSSLEQQIEKSLNPNPTTTPAVGNTPPPGPTDPNGAGVTTGGTSSSVQAALAQAMARAQMAVASRGLNWNDYKDQFSGLYNQVAGEIPSTDTNPNSWFDPNLANNILAGDQSQKENQYRQQVQGLTHRVNPHMLDDTITQILNNQSGVSQKMLDTGLKRGQFNETGYSAGQQALQAAQAAAKSKLLGYASADAGNYNTQLQSVYNQADQAATGYQLGQNFDMSPYQSQISDILNNYQQAGPGDIYNMMGSDPLIDMNSIRMNAGIGQGAINLNNLDVLDALANRQKVNQLGTGIGSQGAF